MIKTGLQNAMKTLSRDKTLNTSSLDSCWLIQFENTTNSCSSQYFRQSIFLSQSLLHSSLICNMTNFTLEVNFLPIIYPVSILVFFPSPSTKPQYDFPGKNKAFLLKQKVMSWIKIVWCSFKACAMERDISHLPR